MRHRALRRHGGQVAAEASLRAAVASAALEGHAYEVEEVRGGTVTDPVVQGALRVAEGLGGLVDLWPRAPRQVLAKLHMLAARGVVPADDLGRLTGGADRIDALADLVTKNTGTSSPILLAAIVHAELLTLRPFAGPSGVVARAARPAPPAPFRRPVRRGAPPRRPPHPDQPGPRPARPHRGRDRPPDPRARIRRLVRRLRHRHPRRRPLLAPALHECGNGGRR